MTTFNLLGNSSFEDGLSGWDLNDDDFTCALNTSGGQHGANFVRAVCDTTLGPDNTGGIVASRLPRSPANVGEVFTFSVYVRGVAGGVGKKVWPQLSFYNAAGSVLTTNAAAFTLTSGWQRFSVTGTAPANTASLAVFVFDWTGSAPNFSIGDTADIDALMVNRGSVAGVYSPESGPNTWAGNANYDLGKLTFQVATQGFVLGEGILGESILGGDSAYSVIPADFTSLTVNDPSVVEDGLFVRREVSTATLTSTLPELLEHKGKRLFIEYGTGTAYAKTVFLGTINDATMTESVDMQPHLAGNTAVRTHRVTLTASGSTEYFATQDANPQNFTQSNSLAQRAQTYLSLGTLGSTIGGDDDVDSGVMDNISPTGILPKTFVADDKDTILNTIWRQSRLYNMYWRLIPWLGRIDFESISRPASGGTTLASALRFTDNPDLVTGVKANELSKRTHTDRTVSYTERQISEDSSLWCTAITVTASLAATPTTVVTFGPFATPGTSRRQDATVDLGVMDVNSNRLSSTVRNFVSTLPLKVKPELFTRSIRAPMQSTAQVQGRVPGLATLNVDGEDQTVAIIGTTHTITPDRWLVDYDIAPPHLLTRESSYDPSPPTNVLVTQAGGAGTDVTISWNTPRAIPRDVPLYKQVRHIQPGAVFNGGMAPADVDFVVVSNQVVPDTELPGDPQSVTVPVASLDGTGNGLFLVQYTQDPTPAAGIGTFNTAYRLGQPTGFTITIT